MKPLYLYNNVFAIISIEHQTIFHKKIQYFNMHKIKLNSYNKLKR